MPIVKNTTHSVVYHTNATGGFTIDESQLPGQNVRDLVLHGVHWSGQWAVARGANTLLNLSGSGAWDLDAKGITLPESSTANVNCTLTGSGSIVLEFKKGTQN